MQPKNKANHKWENSNDSQDARNEINLSLTYKV
jgi:hypothetical protein